MLSAAVCAPDILLIDLRIPGPRPHRGHGGSAPSSPTRASHRAPTTPAAQLTSRDRATSVEPPSESTPRATHYENVALRPPGTAGTSVRRSGSRDARRTRCSRSFAPRVTSRAWRRRLPLSACGRPIGGAAVRLVTLLIAALRIRTISVEIARSVFACSVRSSMCRGGFADIVSRGLGHFCVAAAVGSFKSIRGRVIRAWSVFGEDAERTGPDRSRSGPPSILRSGCGEHVPGESVEGVPVGGDRLHGAPGGDGERDGVRCRGPGQQIHVVVR